MRCVLCGTARHRRFDGIRKTHRSSRCGGVVPSPAPSTALTRTRTKFACATITCARASSGAGQVSTWALHPSLLCGGNGCHYAGWRVFLRIVQKKRGGGQVGWGLEGGRELAVTWPVTFAAMRWSGSCSAASVLVAGSACVAVLAASLSLVRMLTCWTLCVWGSAETAGAHRRCVAISLVHMRHDSIII